MTWIVAAFIGIAVIAVLNGLFAGKLFDRLEEMEAHRARKRRRK